MPNLLVPVDFSPTSAAALRYARHLASALDLDLRVLHVLDTLHDLRHSVSDAARGREISRLEEDLDDFARDCVGHGVTTEVTTGTPAQVVLWESTDEATELIVMGGVGVGADGNHPPGIFGGVARQLATRGGCPVIFIPKGYEARNLLRLGIAFAEAAEVARMAPFTRRLIEALQPTVHFVHVRGKDDEKEAMVEQEFLELADRPNFPSYTFRFAALPTGKVVERLIGYVEAHQVDLLVLGGKHRNFLERLFTPGHLRPILDRTRVPLLVIPTAPIAIGAPPPKPNS